MLKNHLFKSKSFMFLKTHFDYFNSQANNLYDVQIEQLFYKHEAIFLKN